MKTVAGIPVKTLLLIFFLTLLVALLTIAAFKIQPTPPTEIVKLSTVPQTILSLSQNPTLTSSPSGSYYTEDILIDTKQNRLNSIQLELSFDPNIITIYDLVPGDFFNNSQILLKTIDNVNGRISYAISPSISSSATSGSGKVATISFTLSRFQKTATQTAITFLPKTEVISTDTIDSLLKQANSATFIAYPILSPTPTPKFLFNSSSSAYFGSPSAR